MNPRNTLLLAVVALAFGAYLYFVEVGGEDGRAEAERQTQRLFPDVEAEAIQWIALDTSGGPARLEREGSAWRLVEPLAFPADAIGVEGMASNLADLTHEVEIEDAAGPEEYGLAGEARVVRFGTETAEYALRTGRQTPVGPNTYATVEDAPAIFTIATYQATALQKSLDDLREKRILDFDTAAVDRITARWSGGEVVLEKQAGAEDARPSWRMVAPVDSRADDGAVQGLLSSLSFLRAQGFVDAPSEDVLASFAEPWFAVNLELGGEDGASTLRSLAIGGSYESDQRLVRGAESSLYTISADRLSEFPRRVVEYRFRTLSEFSIPDAAQLDLYFQPAEGDPVAITATRGDAGWSSTPEATAPGKLARIVSELSLLEAAEIVTEAATEADLAANELAPPNAILTVLGAAPEAAADEAEAAVSRPKLAEIHLGQREGSEWIVARPAGSATLYRLDYRLAEHLPVSLGAFRNRFLAEEEPAELPEPDPDVLSPGAESP